MNILKMMQQAQELQAKMQELQAELGAMTVEGQAGAGMVTVTLSGKGDMKTVKIDPSLLKPEDAEMLEDLIVAAHNDAKGKAERVMQERMQSAAGGLPLPPGMKLF